MNVNIAVQSPVAPAPTVAEFNPRQNQSVRPVENAAEANADSKRENTGSNPNTNTANEKPVQSGRPPGTDPSVAPQTLLDASLIAENFKATTKLPEKQETALPDKDPAAASSLDNFKTANAFSPKSTTVEAASDTTTSTANGTTTETPTTSPEKSELEVQIANLQSASEIQDPTNRESVFVVV